MGDVSISDNSVVSTSVTFILLPMRPFTGLVRTHNFRPWAVLGRAASPPVDLAECARSGRLLLKGGVA